MTERTVVTWTVEKLNKLRPQISFPEYQRQPNLWTTEKKRTLIDSILIDIDIPKLYLNRTPAGDYEVVDGTQRLWSIWGFLNGEFGIEHDGRMLKFVELAAEQAEKIRNYELQVTIFDDAADEYLRELFVRLQLGLLLVTGEKLNAATGAMRDYIFKRLAPHAFVQDLRIVNRRFARETLAAQIAINSFSRAKSGVFSRTRYEDLLFFFKEYQQPQGSDKEVFNQRTRALQQTLDDLYECFGRKTTELSSRSYIVSIYLLFEERRDDIMASRASQKTFVDFVFALWKRLREESKAGIDRSNRELYGFQTMLSSAPGERYQIERRHQRMSEYLDYYKVHKKVFGD